MTLDLDSTVCEVHGRDKQGAAYGHTKTLGYHPLVAVRDDTGEFIHSRMRSGSSQRGHMRFVSETLARMRRLAPDAEVTVRADAGFFSYDLLDLIEARNASWSFTIPQNAKVKAAIAAIDDKAWQSIAYTRGGQAQVAETTIKTGPRSRSAEPRELRLVVRRTRLTGPQAELWPDWRHHCLVTNGPTSTPKPPTPTTEPTPESNSPSKTFCPSGKFFANGGLRHGDPGLPNTPNTSPSRPATCGTSRQPLRPPHPAPAPQLAGNTPSPQRLCPCSYKRPPRGPDATNPTQPQPQLCTGTTPTRPDHALTKGQSKAAR